MEEQAKLTGDVYDTSYSSPNGDLMFLLKDSTHEFTISLKEILECLKFAEEKEEIPKLPDELWISAYNRYPDMYHGEQDETI